MPSISECGESWDYRPTTPSFPTSLWRVTARLRDRTPPFDGLPVFEVRAMTEALALAQIATARPELEVLAIERRPTLS